MRVLLVSTYELGNQPLHLAAPAAALLAAGHEVRCVDHAVDPLDHAAISWADRMAFSVPMHTAMRLALHVAEAVRAQRPELPMCFYGLYAAMNRDRTIHSATDASIAGEYLPGLLAWASAGDPGPVIQLGRPPSHDIGSAPGPDAGGAGRTAAFKAMDVIGDGRAAGGSPGQDLLPARHLLPILDRYTRLAINGEERLVGSVEASRGCSHRCRHCPVPVVYDGRVRTAHVDAVIADVDQLVAAGAAHVTFADPDFLNAPWHARRVITTVHQRHPHLTFDCTTKVEHILRYPAILPELADAGCAFVVSAFESVNDTILGYLDKGHTVADESRAVLALREHGIEVRPSWLPFTPWTTIDDLIDLVDFVIAHDLVGNVDPVQYTIRLLLPEGSLLLDQPSMTPHLGTYDPIRLGWTWSHPDPAIDVLQQELATLVEERVDQSADLTFEEIDGQIRDQATAAPPRRSRGTASMGQPGPRAHLTEPWFCCSEPTGAQLAPLAGLAPLA